MSTAVPIRLRADNFTPPSRTPWGGQRIVRYKSGLALDPAKAAYARVGECWEISVDPAFPSVVASPCDGPLGAAERLSDVLARGGRALLGRSCDRFGLSTPMLIKLLDAAEPLSVQVHPADDDPHLAADESGKPECWYVLEADAGAGLYLGLSEHVTRGSLRAALLAGDDLVPSLNFVPVARGDMFVIEPGTVHAIGAGVTLVEPQLVLPGKSGKTFRFWDWNRRYDAAGRPSAEGQRRPLHVEASLAVTRFDGPRGAEAIEGLRRRPIAYATTATLRHDLLAELGEMVVERLTGTGRLDLTTHGTLTGLVVVSGTVLLESADFAMAFRGGEAAVLPANLPRFEATLGSAEALLTWMR